MPRVTCINKTNRTSAWERIELFSRERTSCPLSTKRRWFPGRDRNRVRLGRCFVHLISLYEGHKIRGEHDGGERQRGDLEDERRAARDGGQAETRDKIRGR